MSSIVFRVGQAVTKILVNNNTTIRDLLLLIKVIYHY